MKSHIRIAVWLGLFHLLTPSARAQWTSQSFFLHPGWNAVYLEVEPDPRAADAVFANRAVESVWRWNRRFQAVQYIQDPESLLPGDPDWMVWFPESSPSRAALNLHTIEGGRPYLIKVPDNAPPFLWAVQGRPVARPVDWLTDSLNLVGFSVNPFVPPTFGSFFANEPALAGQSIYRLDAAGVWNLVANPAITQMQPGEAFWIRAQGRADFKGPLVIEAEQRAGLVYGRSLSEQTLRIRNASSAPRSITIRQLPSALPPAGVEPLYAGEVPLSYFEMNLAADQYGWKPLQTFLAVPALAPGEERVLRLAVRRGDMNTYTPPAGITGVRYQSLLEITDDAGSRTVVPITSEGLQSFRPATTAHAPSGGGAAGGSPPHPRAGLWVGNAIIQKVNQPAHPSQPDLPVATGTEFQFRLIVHVDASGQARLLQKVLQMWKDGTTKPDPANPDVEILDQPGRYVLLTDESLVASFSGATLRDGDPVGRRISTAAFGFKDPIPMVGSGDFGANTVTCQVTLNFDDPLNPFVHRYHPDHNNLDERFEQPLPEGTESFTVTRDIELQFASTDPEGLALAGWGDNQLGGTYRETITGLHRNTLRLEGVFRLHHLSEVLELNDGMESN
jgi:hypothetical protein